MSSGMGSVPLLLRPAGKDYLWGGRRLKDDFSKELNMTPLAETWECSTHPDGVSLVSGGEFDGMSLPEVLKAHPEYYGAHPRDDGQLPIMVKLIDAAGDLSVQVHPNDDYAFRYENGQLGKSEMWYVLDAAPDSSLVYGLRRSVTAEALREAIEEERLEGLLQKVPIRKNDVFFIEAGKIHAIGAGALVAEIQENSNLTYRLYDYGRRDKDGNLRQLHLDKALEVADLEAAGVPRQPMRVLRYSPGMARELLGRCRYFEVHRMLINTERCKNMARYSPDRISFRVLLCIDGCGTINCPGADNSSFCFFKGDCIFVPADAGELFIHGKAVFLDIKG